MCVCIGGGGGGSGGWLLNRFLIIAISSTSQKPKFKV